MQILRFTSTSDGLRKTSMEIQSRQIHNWPKENTSMNEFEHICVFDSLQFDFIETGMEKFYDA